MNIEAIIQEIIPPDNYQFRNGFSNTHIIDRLNVQEKSLIEEVLINNLRIKEDLLIVETLAYLKSQKSLPVLYSLLHNNLSETSRIIVSASIFTINNDEKMQKIAIIAFKGLEKIQDAYFAYRLIPMFHFLRKFHNQATDELLEAYTRHADFLLSYNAKRALSEEA